MQSSVKYLQEHFPIEDLFDCGFLKSKTDFEYIENRIRRYFGLDSIFEYDFIMTKGKSIKADLSTFSEN